VINRGLIWPGSIKGAALGWRSGATRTNRGLKPGLPALAVTVCVLLAASGAALTPPNAAASMPQVTLRASMAPDRLGVSAAVGFTINIRTQGGLPPAVVTALAISLPGGLGLASSNLGEAICRVGSLGRRGPAGCPPDAIMGAGGGRVEVANATERLVVPLTLTTVMAPPEDDHTGLLIYAEPRSALIANFVFPTEIVGAVNPYSSRLKTAIPPIPSLPGAPDGALSWMHMTLGGNKLTYYRSATGRRHPYHPRGMMIPETCPSGGFPFKVQITFAAAPTTTATAQVPCPGDVAV
jgi:hypothetical protein